MEEVIEIGECSSQGIHNNLNQLTTLLLSSVIVKLNKA